MTEFKRVTKQLCFPKSSPSRANVARASRISRASTVPMMHLMLCTGYPGDMLQFLAKRELILVSYS